MKRVRWSDNVCTVGGTCIHGYFTGDDLMKLLELCPSGSITPTFYDEKFQCYGYSGAEIKKLAESGKLDGIFKK